MLNFVSKPKVNSTSKLNTQNRNTTLIQLKDELWPTKYMPKSIKDSAMHASKVILDSSYIELIFDFLEKNNYFIHICNVD